MIIMKSLALPLCISIREMDKTKDGKHFSF